MCDNVAALLDYFVTTYGTMLLCLRSVEDTLRIIILCYILLTLRIIHSKDNLDAVWIHFNDLKMFFGMYSTGADCEHYLLVTRYVYIRDNRNVDFKTHKPVLSLRYFNVK